MKIAIDISSVIYGTGVSVYTKNLVKNILKIDHNNDYILFGGSLRRNLELKSFLSTFKGKSMQGKVFLLPPTLADIIWNKLHIINIEKLIGKVDVFHSSDWSQPPSKAFNVTTVHDLVPLKFPKLSDPKIVLTHQARMNWVIKEVKRVIVPSIATATDVEELGIESKKIRVIPESVDPRIKPTNLNEIKNLKRKYRISGKYLLAVGANPRKNTENIISAYEKIKADTNLRLVIIGYSHMKVKDIRGVIYPGHIPDNELATFYSGAETLVYPSFYEGFGIPILEAFVCKLPVVTSNIGSMVEVAGKAAILVDPYDADSIAEGILDALKNKEKLVKLGLKRAKQFSWEKTAKETLKVYNEVRE
ncbi:hypothetical protein A2715_05100 [Candidatus Woesebacteria bacterium RIFCSPHIGHO2_01_FULL_39_32]|uniref:Glycosyl transferase family 1 domain-containing protein n=1 Tax=Candidatus Woesebacteria bacterium RIFCSPLOWO2_01_FULL_39_25 TaxID=1802521 RepID=A0A1F8BLH7_9BACT|nr:MAG: hypothetical protein A2715_05100 [Candidatus Woesebacteria bacterium RIFCSPHIGHO2_01_FULL_39_32]OGM38502.1 MAG: hypothetical protein A3F01_04060 [Candidatus Woesebacteria bacterium RIFCSPHIGHO2_12_FULL_38_11]OGM64927.1 MAG: hypothetical protein A2893_04710 [Candidatus Woesebacteria bacterium RIFCSPLOWO2_01_FULL_39_25]